MEGNKWPNRIFNNNEIDTVGILALLSFHTRPENCWKWIVRSSEKMFDDMGKQRGCP